MLYQWSMFDIARAARRAARALRIAACGWLGQLSEKVMQLALGR
jgi:hypothetical protein